MSCADSMQPYPIDHILPELNKAVLALPSVVLQAPPGSGKTTRVPLALLKAMLPGAGRGSSCSNRGGSRRLPRPAGWPGSLTNRWARPSATPSVLTAAISKDTRLEVVTEGILTRRLIDDPALDGVAMIIFDEFHERSLAGRPGSGPEPGYSAEPPGRPQAPGHVGDH